MAIVADCRHVVHDRNIETVTGELGLPGLTAEMDPSFRDVLTQLRRFCGLLSEGGIIGQPKYAKLNSLAGEAQLLSGLQLVIGLYEQGATHSEVARALVRNVGPVAAVQIAAALGPLVPGLPTAVRLAVAVGERRVAVGDAATEVMDDLLIRLTALRQQQASVLEHLG